MLDCPRCATAFDLTARECRHCGADVRPAVPRGVGLICRACGAFHDPGYAWCLSCGQPLAAPTSRAAPAPAPAAVHVPVAPVPPRTAAPPRPSARGATLRLLVFRGDGTPSDQAPIGADGVVAGRSGPLLLDDPAAAPQHVRVKASDDGAVAEDLGSRSGTFLRLRAPWKLATGDEIRIGRQRLRFELHRTGAAETGAGLLVQLWPDGRAKAVFPVRAGANLLGRDLGDIAFPADRAVSARHARITGGGEGLVLEDLGSSNGTFVRLAGPVNVAAGDELLVGNQLLRVAPLQP